MPRYGKTNVVVAEDAADLGRQAAQAVARVMRERLRMERQLRVIFAAGESQMTFLAALAGEQGIEWSRVVCFNLDDFWEPRMPRRFSCGYQTQTQLYDKVKPAHFELVRFDAADPRAEVARFAQAMRDAGPFDILCQGIGTSGHLALNEPGQTDLGDRELVRLVDVAEQSKRQLRDDPNFRDLGYIPEKGITMTVPALMAARHRFTMVPLGLKRPILTRLLAVKDVTADLPASVLLEHEGTLFVDRDSWPEAS